MARGGPGTTERDENNPQVDKIEVAVAVFLGNFLCTGGKIKSREDFFFFLCLFLTWLVGYLVVSQEGLNLSNPKNYKKKNSYVRFVSYWSHLN